MNFALFSVQNEGKSAALKEERPQAVPAQRRKSAALKE